MLPYPVEIDPADSPHLVRTGQSPSGVTDAVTSK